MRGVLRALPLLLLIALVPNCGRGQVETPRAVTHGPALYPGETPELRRMINHYAAFYDVPAPLIHRLIDRESDYRADARNGPYYGLLQMLPQTARTMGHQGPASELLDPDVNLRYGVRYLRGAWLLSDGDYATAIGWYARGYYYEARNRCLLVATGLNDREIARHCR